ncbi:copper resistance CopC family protein [Solibacillus merdavium]|uniref:Copper resistance protein CopC n=1 Tax=Solibacillus merdavium TaxID=2762218 RepID=A0ABR8XM22_9BACL|nr:copper resistance protein CopC [Solibacillus merdavium]MBD8032980.1 copper resistance protein CopC [Solibacillus merdavium]
MMKQLLLALAATFLLFVPGANAHTYLDSTNPAKGATVTEDLRKIELKYSGEIEEGSIFKVLSSDGSEMPITSITLNDGVLTGTLASPLPNDTYIVEWNSISEDGHPLTGTFSFTVNTAKNPNNQETAADTVEKLDSNVDSIVDTLKDETDSEGDNSIWTLIIVVAIIVLVLVVITMYSYKRWLVKRKGNS